MQVYLCSTIGEIRHRLAFPRNPLDIFKLLNLYPPQNWRFVFRFDVTQKVVLDIEFGPEGDPLFAISSGVLGIFDCDKIEVRQSGRSWECAWHKGTSLKAEQNVLEYFDKPDSGETRPRLRLTGFAGETFPRELSQWQSIEEYLYSNTWMGSYSLPSGRFSTDIAVFDNRRTFKNSSVVEGRLKKSSDAGTPTLVHSQSLGSPPVGEVHVLSACSDSAICFRWTHGGAVTPRDLKDQLGIDLSGWPISGEIEVTFPNRKLGPDGTLAMDGACQQIVSALNSVGTSLGANAKVVQFKRDCEEFDKKASARRIDQRKANLLQAKFVYFKNRLVYRLPTSENETVSLHQKLEGMAALPFAEFVSLEYTPKLGIDAIVNFRIREVEALHRFATVEFEHRFDNFFAHAHPVEQTDMIICWEGARVSPTNEWRYEPDSEFPWLGYLHVSGKVIKVVQVSKYPGLELRGIEGRNHGG
jgi:hypothetical protein